MSDTTLVFLWLLSIPIIVFLARTDGLHLIGSFLKRIFTVIFKLVIWITIGFIFVVAVDKIFSSDSSIVSSLKKEKGSCDKGGVYSKQFNCEYIYNKATYDVYYWRYLNSDKSERQVGTVVGLSSCRDTAIYAHRNTNEKMKQNLVWNERMYVCMLTKDGRNLEKHRY